MMIFKPYKKKFPLVRQYDQTDCGPAALLSVLKYYGGNDSLVHVRELCRTTGEGTTMFDLVYASDKLGFEVNGVKGDYEALLAEEMPCIAHVLLEDRQTHYMVIYKINEKSLLLGDPGKGLITLKRKDFEAMWTSRAVMLLKPTKMLYNKVPIHWLSWIFSYFKQESIWINQSVFFGIVYTVFGLTTAILIQLLIDDLIPSKDLFKIGYIGGL